MFRNIAREFSIKVHGLGGILEKRVLPTFDTLDLHLGVRNHLRACVRWVSPSSPEHDTRTHDEESLFPHFYSDLVTAKTSNKMDVFGALLVLVSVIYVSLAQSTLLPNGFPVLSEAMERQIRCASSPFTLSLSLSLSLNGLRNPRK